MMVIWPLSLPLLCHFFLVLPFFLLFTFALFRDDNCNDNNDYNDDLPFFFLFFPLLFLPFLSITPSSFLSSFSPYFPYLFSFPSSPLPTHRLSFVSLCLFSLLFPFSFTFFFYRNAMIFMSFFVYFVLLSLHFLPSTYSISLALSLCLLFYILFLIFCIISPLDFMFFLFLFFQF